jgi:transcriptional regulator with XRE-family HTH domain
MSELMEIVAKRIRQCRQEKGWTLEETAERLAQASGQPFGYSRFSNWEQASRMPPSDMVLLLAKVFGKTPAWINGYTDTDSLSAVTSNYVTANPPTIQTKAGPIPLTQASDSTAFSLGYVESRGMNCNKLLYIKQIDGSMAPEIAEGDELLIDGDQTTVRGADLFGIIVAGNIWIRWICPEMDGTFIVRAGDSGQYPDNKMTLEELQKLDIVGRVVRISHDR